MDRKTVVGVYWKNKLQRVFEQPEEAEEYIKRESRDPNVDKFDFGMKVLPDRRKHTQHALSKS